MDAATDLAVFRFHASGLPRREAFEAWREIMSRMFLIESLPSASVMPSGGLSAFLLGDVMANRSSFNVQRLTRDRRRIEATPDHLLFQLYRSGGFAGEIGGGPVRVSRGQIAVCDLRRPLDVRATNSHTLGLTVPRRLLDHDPLYRHPARLDLARERLLAARITMLHTRLPKLAEAALQAPTSDLLAALNRLFDPSPAADVLDAPEFDADFLTLAERVIAEGLASPDLSPATIADRLRISRATLYRVFAPVGGVMRHVWAMRLEAVRAALDQPASSWTLARLADDHGFKTASHLSRSFRNQYGATPRDWWADQVGQPHGEWVAELDQLRKTWRTLAR